MRESVAILTTNASKWGWGGVCQIREQQEIVSHCVWSKGWQFSSSNQRKLTAILFFSGAGIEYVQVLPMKQTMDSEVFVNDVKKNNRITNYQRKKSQ
ncbi:MAG: hypothetical protein EZS28_039305 [Streblomastix strix]|uniref:Uncharacterized protein n=1 Tax=Streblomastix strix TaxID=222440 RepID=A0A5J4U4B8_9EUKA|nr:MAG: hypothetical protein EZS28_039305 [Streblomastix strix]